jgi:esterase/lipase superfamily enzyme
MMPTPVLVTGGKVNPFDLVPPQEQHNTLDVFYVTDRVGKGPADKREYGNDVDNKLNFGKATVQFGSAGMKWDQLVSASVAEKRSSDVKLSLTRTIDGGAIASNGKAFAADLNGALDRVARKEIAIYVQGYRDDFEGSAVVAAELRHYLGHRQVIIAYSWPCRQRIVQFKGDVARAKESAPHLADLIEFLAANTRAEHINVLGYSAGAMLVVDGLEHLRERHGELDAAALQKQLRVGNVILAAASVDLQTFVRKQLAELSDLSEHLNVTVSDQDTALSWAGTLQGASVVGRPDNAELTPQDLESVAQHKNLYVIDVSTVKGPHSDKSGTAGHGYWYTNPWVSSDILTILLWQFRPDERGLVRVPEKWRWTFPPDYPQRVQAVVSQSIEKLRQEQRQPAAAAAAVPAAPGAK